MKVRGEPYQSIWIDEKDEIRFINQQLLPFEFRVDTLGTTGEVIEAIRAMKVRGAPLIGATASLGIYLACLEAEKKKGTEHILEYIGLKAREIKNTRPTAVNLAWAVDRVMKILEGRTTGELAGYAREEALHIIDLEKKSSLRIGRHGLPLLKEIHDKKNKGTVNILTHCNAGWLACIDYGTATAPVYMAHDMGMPVHVWVDETRPRLQGARLTAWELGQHGVPHTVITDNEGGHLMQKGLVDLVLAGSDRTTRRGDVANKVGTYLKALAAHDNGIPFYAALPSSSIDFGLTEGLKEITIEQRGEDEIRTVEGMGEKRIQQVRIMPADSPVSNHGFDITPARLVTGLITERGICRASEKAIMQMFPERQ
jgi:methylthioribose-1-phosphate isomerase